jgi:hypothetical protein
MDVWVADAIVADLTEIMEDERLWDLECLTWFPRRGGNRTGAKCPQASNVPSPSYSVLVREPGEAIERSTLDTNQTPAPRKIC